MISEGCDTVDWNNNANSALITEINYILTYIHIKNNITVFTVFLIK